MGAIRELRKFVADFETTVYEHQTKTEVWAVGIAELYQDTVYVLHSIEEFFEFIFDLKQSISIKFHNLKFDGTFILYSLMEKLKKRGFKHAYDPEKGFLKIKEMPSRAFSYLISSMGQWYSITIKNGRQLIKIEDSLKLIPASIEEIGKTFGTKHRKLSMKYEGVRYPGCNITEDEEKYIKNDVLVLKEAIEIMEAQGHTKLTIGSCCLSEYKKIMGADYETFFPRLDVVEIDEKKYQARNIDQYCRRSYKGGWCYLVSDKKGKIFKNGVTLDVNSLYPSMMHSLSGNYYPTGTPKMFSGEIPDCCLIDNERWCNFYYFVTIRTRFRLKKGMLPCIQIKGNKLYKSTEWLKTSDIEYNGKFYENIKDREGNVISSYVTLTLTCTDFELIKKHYDLIDMKILHGCVFRSEIGLFDEYIDKYMEIKKNSKGSIRTIAKLFLNNLYGKLASSSESSYKVAYINDKGSLSFHIVLENDKTPGHIATGSAITSYSREFTINAAQANYYEGEERGFIYADTDSIHCASNKDDIKSVKIHETELCSWKVETEWNEGIFVRQKTYIEKSDDFDIKCAGMPKNCKELYRCSVTGETPSFDLSEEQIEFLKHKRTLEDFKPGLRIFGKLMPRQYPGGTLLVPTYFEMRG